MITTKPILATLRLPETLMAVFLFQDLAVNTRTAVCQVLVPMEEHAALCLVAVTCVHASLVTPVVNALMTQMNVQSRHLFARMKACVSTLRALTSEIFIKAYDKYNFIL